MPHRPQTRPLARWLATSKSLKTGRYVRTYHADESAARKRLVGNALHTDKRLVDTQPPQVKK